MTAEERKELSGNYVTLHDHFDVQFSMIQANVDTRFDAHKEAIRIATDNIERRLSDMNEFRGQLKDQAAKFITRDEYSTAHETIRENLRKIENWQSGLQGMASQKAVSGFYVISILALLLSFFDIVFRFIK